MEKAIMRVTWLTELIWHRFLGPYFPEIKPTAVYCSYTPFARLNAPEQMAMI